MRPYATHAQCMRPEATPQATTSYKCCRMALPKSGQARRMRFETRESCCYFLFLFYRHARRMRLKKKNGRGGRGRAFASRRVAAFHQKTNGRKKNRGRKLRDDAVVQPEEVQRLRAALRVSLLQDAERLRADLRVSLLQEAERLRAALRVSLASYTSLGTHASLSACVVKRQRADLRVSLAWYTSLGTYGA
jgi:hypothetical protein